jgi:hypothetical protein
MGVLRHVAVWCCMASAAGCAKGDDQAATDTGISASAPAPAAEPGQSSLAGVAGRWQMRAIPDSGTSDTSATEYVLTATSDTSGWTMTYPGRPPVPVRVTLAGSRFITEAGPYESGRRKGVQVTSSGVLRLEGGKLVGTRVGRYTTRGADSVIRVRVEGTRLP